MITRENSLPIARDLPVQSCLVEIILVTAEAAIIRSVKSTKNTRVKASTAAKRKNKTVKSSPTPTERSYRTLQRASSPGKFARMPW